MLSEEINITDAGDTVVGVARNVPGGTIVVLSGKAPVYVPRVYCTEEGELESLTPRNIMRRLDN